MKEYLLNDVLNFYHGKAIKSTDGDVPIYGSNGIIGTTHKSIYKDAIILGRVGAYCGSVERCKGDFWASDNTIVVKSKDDFINDYCYYLLKSIPLNSYAGGAAQPLITQGKLKSLSVKVPCISTQQKIAEILSAYDDIIENNQKRIKLLEEAAQRLYKEWFVDLRFPGYENTPIIDGVPQGWNKIAINDIAEYINGYAFKPSDWGEFGKPIIKIKEMGDGITKDTPRNTGADIPEKYHIYAGDILFSWSATLSAMIWDGEDGLLNQHLFKVVPYEAFSREYVLQSILYTLNEFQNLTTGATMKHIQRGKLKEVFINAPDKTTMRKYNLLAEPIRQKILSLKKQNLNLTEARDRLLPKLMSGELEV